MIYRIRAIREEYVGRGHGRTDPYELKEGTLELRDDADGLSIVTFLPDKTPDKTEDPK